MKLLKILIINFLLVDLLFPQVFTSTTKIDFSQVVIPNNGTSVFYICNKTKNNIVVKVFNYSPRFIKSDSVLNINKADSVMFTLTYNPIQNVEDKDLLVFEAVGGYLSQVIKVTGTAKYNDSYDNTTYNKYDTDLKTALTALVTGHTSLGYNTGRDRMFQNIDKLPGDTIECVYSGRKVKAATRTEAQNQGFNTEHSWPQSMFNSNDPMVSDINHLYPTDETPNNRRGNYPFGIVTSGITYEIAGSKLGRNSANTIVFEPRDVHKGDLSRAMLYFQIRYPQNYGSFLDATQEQVFRQWSKFDPVSLKEKNRNNGVQTYQGKRNPFIDHPEFIDRIYSFITGNLSPKTADFKTSPKAAIIDGINLNENFEFCINLLNSGSKSYNVTSVVSGSPKFVVQNFPTVVQAYSTDSIKVKFVTSDTGLFSGSITVQSDAGTQVVNIAGVVGGSATGIKIFENPINNFRLEQNYPNPFNPSTKINFQIPFSTNVTLKIYDVMGKLIAIPVSEELKAGFYSREFNASMLPAGVYFYELNAGEYRIVKNMMFLK